eukprot:812903-Prymnesium_polylepis.1
MYGAAEHRNVASLDANARATAANDIAKEELHLARRTVDVDSVILRNRRRVVPNGEACARDSNTGIGFKICDSDSRGSSPRS